jgi:hypothetical protein
MKIFLAELRCNIEAVLKTDVLFIYGNIRRWVSPFSQATKTVRESRGIALLCFLDLGTRRG